MGPILLVNGGSLHGGSIDVAARLQGLEDLYYRLARKR